MDQCKGVKRFFNYRLGGNYLSLHVTYAKKDETKLSEKFGQAKKLLSRYYTGTEGAHPLLGPESVSVRNLFEEMKSLDKAPACPYRVTVYVSGDVKDTELAKSLVSELEELFGIKAEPY